MPEGRGGLSDPNDARMPFLRGTLAAPHCIVYAGLSPRLGSCRPCRSFRTQVAERARHGAPTLTCTCALLADNLNLFAGGRLPMLGAPCTHACLGLCTLHVTNRPRVRLLARPRAHDHAPFTAADSVPRGSGFTHELCNQGRAQHQWTAGRRCPRGPWGAGRGDGGRLRGALGDRGRTGWRAR